MKPLTLDGCVTQGTRESWATLSPCGLYRYMLGRSWGPDDADDDVRPTLSVFMLNPSTADHAEDDPTIRKCVHFAKQEGCSSLLVRNLFAWRSADPAALRRVGDPYGPRNEDALRLGPTFGQRVAAWGALGPSWLRSIANRSKGIIQTTPGLYVLHLTKAGEPGHPLFLRNTTRVRLWVDAERGRQAGTFAEDAPPPPTLDELLETMRGLRPLAPAIASVAVAPDVFAKLTSALPICRGDALSAGGLHVFASNALPPGTMLPLDKDGKPIPPPAAAPGGSQ